MNCPRCTDATLDVTNRAGIEVDTCPECRGVWLDRDEIDRLVASMTPPADSNMASVAPAEFAPQPSSFVLNADDSGVAGVDDILHRDDDDDDDDDRERDRDRDRDRKSRKHKKRKKDGLLEQLGEALEEIFDL